MQIEANLTILVWFSSPSRLAILVPNLAVGALRLATEQTFFRNGCVVSIALDRRSGPQ